MTTPPLSAPDARLFDAVELAARAHRGQFRKATRVPYLVHPLGVMRTLAGWGAPDDVVIAGALHDVVEDTPVTLEELAAAFGPGVARLVEGASEPDKGAAWEERKRHTIEALGHASREALLLTCADKLDNLRAVREDIAAHGEAAWSRFKRGRAQQGWYYGAIADVMDARLGGEPARALRAEVTLVFGARPGE